MATARQKRGCAILVAVVFAIAFAGYSMSNLDRFRPQNVPMAAKLGFIICWSGGGACGFLWAAFGFLAKSMRKPGVSWLGANCVFDFSFVLPLSDLYAEEGIRTLRKGRNCFLAWLLFWGLGVAIAIAGELFR